MALLSIALFVVAGFLFAGNLYDYEDSWSPEQPLPSVDVIVCLVGGRGRITAAGELWKRYWEEIQNKTIHMNHPPMLYLSGLGEKANWSTISKQFKKSTLLFIREEDVVLEKKSSNTEENAQWLLQYAIQHQWKRIFLVTSSYHMRRAQLIFEKTLKTSKLSAQMETYTFSQEPFTKKKWRSDWNSFRVTLVEYLKWMRCRLNNLAIFI